MDGSARPRNYPNGSGAPGPGRRSNENRRPPGAPGGPPSSAASSARSAMSRAERFEDERRRITASCFAKVDGEGQLEESYITHIRIVEDGAHPQTPSPPSSNPANKKPRVIMISVTKHKLVRLHKSRENANGTFSIGKTWELYLLSGIENYVHTVPRTEEEAQHKQWAGETGFVVTIAKPYYWEASTGKEKEFFIGSLTKIYSKYTDKHHRKEGKFPILSGFSAAELMALTEGRPYAATEEGRNAFDIWIAPYEERAPPDGDLGPYVALSRAWARSRGGPSPLQPERLPSPGDSRQSPAPEERKLPAPRGIGRPPTSEGPQRERMPRQPGPPSMPNIREAATNRGIGPPGIPLSPRNGPPGAGTPPTPNFQDGPKTRPSIEQNLRSRPSRENMALRPSQSRERLQPSPVPTPPLPSLSPQRLSPQSSRSNLRPKTPDVASAFSVPPSLTPGRLPRAEDTASQRSQKSLGGSSFDNAGLGASAAEPRRPNGFPSPGRRDPSPRGLRPGTSQSNGRPGTSQSSASSTFPLSEDPVPEDIPPKAALPERRRPQMDTRPSQQSQRSVESLESGPPTRFHTPVQSPPQPTAPPMASPMAPPPRRRPQEIPEKQKPAPGVEPVKIDEFINREVSDDDARSFRAPLLPTSPLPRISQATEQIPKALDSKPLAPRPLEPRAFEPKAFESRVPEPRTLEPKAFEPRAPGPRALEQKAFESRAPGPRAPEQKAFEPRAPEPRAPEPRAPEPKAPNPQAPEARAPEPKVPEPKAPEPSAPESRALEPGAPELMALEPLKEPVALVEKSPHKESDAAPADTVTSPTEEEKEEDVAHRPGLGPMLKKQIGSKADTASAFRKAAAAAGAFKPRAGGAAAKLFAKDAKTSEEPDGISAVFVPQRPTPKEEVEKKLELEPKPTLEPSSRERPKIDTEVVPEVKVSSPLSPTPVLPTINPEEALPLPSPLPTPEQPAAKVEPEAEVRRKKRRSNQQVMNISKLGIDPGMLDGLGLEFESLLSEIGWGSSELSSKNIDSLEFDIKREIARVEAGSWLNHLEQKDDRVEAVEKMLDRAIAECDELEGLLTLYNVELGSLNDDIAFIEAQSQGLQVQTANQRLLQHELKQLVDTISITTDQLEPLRRAPIGKTNGLRAIESSLVLLYKALLTIDPTFIEGRRSNTVEDLSKMTSNPGFGNSDLASMRALQEKKDRYLNEGALFLDRLKKHMEITFGAAFLQTKDTLASTDKRAMPSTKANVEAHNAGRKTLWMLSPLILFAKEIDRASWEALLRMYQAQAGMIYQDEIRDNILAWKRFARKPTGDEQDLLFTALEKEPESITGAARKLTVKRSQTLARGLRAASGDKETKAYKAQEGKLFAYDVFSKVLEDIGPVLLTEQNFITEFFHATSTDAVDFPDAVNSADPEDRRGPNLWIRKQYEADRTMAKRVAEVMEDIFAFWPTEIQNLVEWAVIADPLQGVGILCAVDRKLVEIEESNQDFLTRNLQKVHERLTGLFIRFVDEQIRAIEDTKVKIKKRKGVIAFMKTFPHFAMAIENMLPSTNESEQLEIRRMVDDAYQKINKAMFESLKVIAKESPAVMATQGQGDPEDKEALNYHILLMENMNHYIEEVDGRTDTVLLEWRVKAQEEMKEHMDLYVDAVIRRPLGKLLEFIESTETLLSQPGASPQSIAQRSSHSRSVFKKLVHAYDSKEIRKGVESLKKRIDKHFGDADDPRISRDLVFKVLKECERKYTDVCDRTVRVNQDVYAGEVEPDWGASEITAAFRR